PVRLAIPAIGVNAAVVETGLEVVQWLNSPALRWQTPDYAVGHRQTSARPGQPGNMILSGHNNTAGSVFLRLSELKPGDEFTVYTADFSYNYRVVASEKVLWTGAGERQIARHYELTADTPDETLTLVSCWPYATYTHRLYVTAKPVPR
ncbi:MAG: sortase, partial [Anaerolineae bacterium]